MAVQAGRRAGWRLAYAGGRCQSRIGLRWRRKQPGVPSGWSRAAAMRSAGCGGAARPALLGLLLTLLVPGGGASKTSVGLVTCGSVLKLLNTHHRVRLHSHDIKYGSGARGWGSPRGRGRGWGFEGAVVVVSVGCQRARWLRGCGPGEVMTGDKEGRQVTWGQGTWESGRGRGWG
jgi:hypothetical protein